MFGHLTYLVQALEKGIIVAEKIAEVAEKVIKNVKKATYETEDALLDTGYTGLTALGFVEQGTHQGYPGWYVRPFACNSLLLAMAVVACEARYHPH